MLSAASGPAGVFRSVRKYKKGFRGCSGWKSVCGRALVCEGGGAEGNGLHGAVSFSALCFVF